MVKRHQAVTTRAPTKKSGGPSTARSGAGGRGGADRDVGRRDANSAHSNTRAGGRRGGKQKDSDDDDEDGHHYSAIAAFIPPELDEDIDDDLAFNSDDDELYGAYFQQSSPKRSAKKETKKKVKAPKNDPTEDDPLDRLEALGKANKVSGGKGAAGSKQKEYSSSDDDNGDRSDSEGEYMDLSDMLDSAPSVTVKKQSGAAAKKSSITPTPAVVPASQATKKASRKASIVEEPESLLGPFSEVDGGSASATKKKKGTTAHDYTNALETLLVKPASQRKKAESADPEADEALHSVRTRLEHAFSNRGTLLSTDMDEYEKEKLTRKHERELVGEEMTKYNAFLKEQREAKHIAFPMRPPESNPVPSSIGALLAAARDRQQRPTAATSAGDLGASEGTSARTAVSLLPQNLFQSVGNRSVESSAAASQVKAVGVRRGEAAQRLISSTQAMLAAAGLSAEAIDQEAKTGVVMEALLKEHESQSQGKKAKAVASDRPVSFGEHVSFGKEDDADGAGGDGSEMTHSYMAKLKAMLAYEVNKRRRFNKIKSKTYRRLLRKEKEKEKKQRDEVFTLLHPQQARERLAQKLEVDRARERLTQKHKNTSKWVKHIKQNKKLLLSSGDGPNSESLQDALDEQHLLHQMLMQKMDENAGDLQKSMLYHEQNGDDDDESTDSDDEVVDELIGGANGAGITSHASERRKAVESLLWKVIDEDDRDGADARAEKLRNATPVERARAELKGMDFMKNANARKREEMREQVEALADDVERYRQGADDEESIDDDGASQHLTAERTKKKAGKAVAAGAGKVAAGRVSFKEKDEDMNDAKNRKSKTVPMKEREVRFKQRSGISLQENAGPDDRDDTEDAGNGPTFASDEDFEETEVPFGDALATKDSAQNDKSDAAQPRRSNSSSAALSGFAGDRASSTKTSTRVSMLATGIKRKRDPAEDSNGRSGSSKAANTAVQSVGEPNLEEQQAYLISRAFASDDVDEDFLAQKRGYVEQVMKPRDANETLPGWGEWGGDSEENQQLNKRHLDRVSRIELERNIQRQQLMRSRADAKLDNVIINHDGVELVPDRMTLHMVPRPFSNPTEFTRSMRQPLGPEWTSSVLFKDANQPRVTVNQGQAVMPLDISMRRKTSEAKTSRRKAGAAKKVKGKQ